MTVNPEHIQLSDDQKQDLARIADETGKPWAEVLSEAIQSYRHSRRRGPNGHHSTTSLYDALKGDGLIGIAKDAPSDLSTNPMHIEGFGRVRGNRLRVHD